MFNPPGDCPVCDESVPRGRKSCPHCGADPRTGWNDDEDTANGLDLPDPDFNYEDFVEREFGNSPKTRGLPWIWWITGVLVLLGLVGMCFLP
jgi:hypothetical protein